MKIYSSRYPKDSIERFIGKDIWVRCIVNKEVSAQLYEYDKFIRFLSYAESYNGVPHVLVESILCTMYDNAVLFGITDCAFKMLDKLEDAATPPHALAIPMPTNTYIPRIPLEVYTSEELEDICKQVIDREYESADLDLPFDI